MLNIVGTDSGNFFIEKIEPYPLSLGENNHDISNKLRVFVLCMPCLGLRISIQGFPLDPGEGPSSQIPLHCQDT